MTNNLSAKKDRFNTIEYVNSTGNGKDILILKLNILKQNTKERFKKESTEKSAEEQASKDFKSVDDPNRETARGFTEAEIGSFIGRIK